MTFIPHCLVRPLVRLLPVAVAVALAARGAAAQATLHVAKDNPGAEPPFASWATAAPDIQTAIDAAAAGDVVLVADGTYDGGERTTEDGVANRIVVADGVTVRSANGAAAAILAGGENVRCAALLGTARLEGFGLTGARNVGGLWGEDGTATAEGCRIYGNDGLRGGGARGVALVDCAVEDNAATLRGGGAYECVLTRCALSGNSAELGGGAASSVLRNSVVVSNSASMAGGGAYESLLYNCLLAGNWAAEGGGAADSDLHSSTVAANRAEDGGGLRGGTAFNCIAFGNARGDGTPDNWADATLHFSCAAPLPPGDGNFDGDPLFADAARFDFRPLAGSPCIDAGTNLAWMAGAVDLDGKPRVLDDAVDVGAYEFESVPPPDPRLAVYGPGGQVLADGAAPDAAAGTAWSARTGQSAARAFGLANVGSSPLEVSAMEWAGPDADAFSVPSFPFGVDPGSTGSFLVVFSPAEPRAHEAELLVHHSAVDAASPFTVRFLCAGAAQAERYVSAGNPNAAAPFETPEAAAADIQSAIDVSFPGDVIWVAAGDYEVGEVHGLGDVAHRVAATNAVALRSLGGATIVGGEGVRGVYLGPGSSLSGFTVTGGANAGGIWCADETAVVSNCVAMGNSAVAGGGVAGGTVVDSVLLGNAAEIGGGAFNAVLVNSQVLFNQAEIGGGAADSQLVRCLLAGNVAGDSGGGAYGSVLRECRVEDNVAAGELGSGGGAADSTLYSCLLRGNEAAFGGGAANSHLYNCTVVENAAAEEGGGLHGGTAENCVVVFNAQGMVEDNLHYDTQASHTCSAPLPPGPGNVDSDPLFADRESGDFRLATNSPCIDAGLARAWMDGAADLDDNPRAVGPAPDMGAFEHPFTPSGLPAAWLLDHALPLDGSADFLDADEDGMDNWSEWRCGTDPRDPLSRLALERAAAAAPPDGIGWVVRWSSVPGRFYVLERATNLAHPSPFLPIAGPLPGAAGHLVHTDRTAAAESPAFYRVVLP